MTRLAAPLLVLLFVLAIVTSPVTGAADKPNIIYVMLDDAGYGDFETGGGVGGGGSKHVQTPAFDRMCEEGTRFTHHYSGSAVCAPTRCVLMTGLHTGHCRRRDNQAKARRDRTRNGLVFLEDGDLTVAESLKPAGYATAGIGKWGLGNPGSAGVPEKQGFDLWFGYLDQVHAHNHYPAEIWDGGKMVPVPGNQGKKAGTYMHDLFEARTLEFIRDHRRGPFFLYLAYTLPHGKYVIPHDDPAYAPYADKPWPQQVRNYAAMITRADRSVGKVLALLDELDIDDDTIVFYTSDNGPNAPFVKPLDSAGGLRGTKRRLYEGGIRAAMAVRWPGRVPAGRTSEFVWDMRDFFRTACELAGVAPPPDRDGISVLPTLLGHPQEPHEHLYWEYHSPFQQAVRKGVWKGVRWGTAEPVELYNVVTDPGEDNDVSDLHPEIAQELAGIMDSSRTASPFWPAHKRRGGKQRGRR